MNPPSIIFKKRVLGNGSFGKTYLISFETHPNEMYALKQLYKPFVSKDSLLKEYNFIKTLKNENFNKVFDLFENGDYYELVMELADTNLKEYFEKKNFFPINEIKHILLSLNNIFYEMNNNNYFFRDIKPENILIKFNQNIQNNNQIYNYTVKLNDIGILKLQMEKGDLKNYCGYQKFLSPELLNYFVNRKKNFDNRSDIYSIGMLLYYLLFQKIYKYGDSFEFIEDEDLKNLLPLMLKENPNERISWNDYFQHNFCNINNLNNNYLDIKKQNFRNYLCVSSYKNNIKENLNFYKNFELKNSTDMNNLNNINNFFNNNSIHNSYNVSIIPSNDPILNYITVSNMNKIIEKYNNFKLLFENVKPDFTNNNNLPKLNTILDAYPKNVSCEVEIKTIDDNNTFYNGECKKDSFIKHGRGIYINLTEKEIIIGQFENAQPNGKCEKYYLNNNPYYFEGEFKNSSKNKGFYYTFNNQTCYYGDWENDKFHGFGTKLNKNNSYRGDWKYGKREGKGVETYSNNEKYEGDFKNDKREGKGIYYYNNETYYDGEWIEDKKDGNGKIVEKDGKVFEGKFIKGIKNGYGKLMENGKIIEDGIYKDGKIQN